VDDATPETVFDAFTDPEAQRERYADAPDWVVESACDLRVGGRWTIQFGLPEAGRPWRPASSRWSTGPGVAGATLTPLDPVADPQHVRRPPPAHPGRRGLDASFSAGAAIGPVLGGLLLEWFWWGSVFLVAVPVMAVLLLLGPVLLPEFRDPDAGRLDLRSAALSVAELVAVLLRERPGQDPTGWP